MTGPEPAASAAPTAAQPGEGGASVSPDYTLYDFRKPRHISNAKRRALEAMHARLAKALEAWVSGRLRTHIPIVLEQIDASSFGEFTSTLPATCACFGFSVRNSAALEGAIDISPELAFSFVDGFFGGSGRVSVMNRALTFVERLAVRTVAERITHHLAEVWQDHVPLTMEVTSFESEPDMVHCMRRDDEVLVAKFVVQGTHGHGVFRICMPLGAIERFFETSDRRASRAPGGAGHKTASNPFAEATVRRMQVDVSVRMPAFDVPIRQLLALPPGTVLSTGLSTDATLEVYVCDTHRFFATPGRVGSRMAVRVLDALQAAPLDGHAFEPPSASTSV